VELFVPTDGGSESPVRMEPTEVTAEALVFDWVPDRRYWLRHGNDYFESDAPGVNLGTVRLGPPDPPRVQTSTSTSLTLDLRDLVPWGTGAALFIYLPSLGSYTGFAFGMTPPLVPDATTTTSSLSYDALLDLAAPGRGMPLVPSPMRATIVQRSAQQTDAGIVYRMVAAATVDFQVDQAPEGRSTPGSSRCRTW
jgi:hypothetical protein